MKKIDVILVNYYSIDDTIECVESLQDSIYPIRHIILIDNSFQKEELSQLADQYDNLKYLQMKDNLGFAGGNNFGIKESLKNDPDYILLLNNDTVVKPDFLEKLVHGCNESNVDIGTGKIYYHHEKDLIWGAGGWMNWRRGFGQFYGNNKKDDSSYSVDKPISFVCGCMMLIKRDVFDKIGLLDEDYFMYCEDVAFTLNASSAGMNIRYIADSIIWHKVGANKVEDSAFLFYYFLRNSLLIVKRFAGFKHKMMYLSYAPMYFLAKVILASFRVKNIWYAFLFGVRDGLINNGGKKDYSFLRRK